MSVNGNTISILLNICLLAHTRYQHKAVQMSMIDSKISNKLTQFPIGEIKCLLVISNITVQNSSYLHQPNLYFNELYDCEEQADGWHKSFIKMMKKFS